MARKKKIEVPLKTFDTKDGSFCVYEIYNKSGKTIYHFRGDQAKNISSIILDGFIGLPSGLYLNRNGYGFGKKGAFLLSALKQNFGSTKPIELIISNKSVKSISKTTLKVTVTLPKQDIQNLLVRLGRINEDNNNELRDAVASFLSTKFPKQIKTMPGTFDEYQSGEIAALLRRNKVIQKLSEEDLQGLKVFFPKIFEASFKGKKRSRIQRDALIRDTRGVTDRIFLDEVIKEFEQNIAKKTLREEEWQRFLKDKVFRYISNYVTVIDKQNVSLDVSYPDFVLVDVYGFIDIFEIKKHDMPLLSFDSDHENYYWKSEVVQAISQIENYIDAVIHNADDYIKSIKRKKHINVRVIRPRGYIIAGTSKQFKDEKELEDFHKLSTVLKNTSFVLYDELLEKLKNIRAQL